MRLRNIKGASSIILESTYLIKNPISYKGNFSKLFNNDNPIEIEIGMGKGNFIIEKALKNPDIALITSVKKFVDSNSNNDLKLLLDKDLFATDVYSLGFENNSFGNLDFKNGIIKYKK